MVSKKTWSKVLITQPLTMFLANFKPTNFSVLPCRDDPPAAPAGGKFWYNIKAVKYECAHGMNFEGQAYHEYSNCTPTKVWSPAELPDCVRKYEVHLKISKVLVGL